MSTNSKRWLAVAAALVLLGGGWWLGQRSAPPGTAAEAAGDLDGSAMQEARDARATSRDPSERAVATAPSTGAAGSGPAGVAAMPAPLPPPDTPLAEMFEPLLERARSGDSGAACRLASELQRCRDEAVRRGFGGREMEARVAGEDDDERREAMIRAMARMEEERERAERVCTGITSEQIALAFPLQLQAAQARPELRTWVAINPALDTRFFLDDIERWQQYRQVAMPWLEAAAARGDPSALIALARVHGDDRHYGPPIPPFREPDDARFITYASLLERYGLSIWAVQRAAGQARERVAADVLAAAERRADALFRPDAVIPREQRSRTMRESFQRAPQSVDCD